jgi:hypothetical protein
MIIEITIGVLFCTSLFFAFLTWKEKRKLKKLKEAYNESDDKSKRRIGKLEGSELNTDGNTEFAGRILLPASAIASDGIDKTRIGADEPEDWDSSK